MTRILLDEEWFGFDRPPEQVFGLPESNLTPAFTPKFIGIGKSGIRIQLPQRQLSRILTGFHAPNGGATSSAKKSEGAREKGLMIYDL